MFFDLLKHKKKENSNNIKFETRGKLTPNLVIELLIDKHVIGYVNCIRRNGIFCIDEMKIYNEKDIDKGYEMKLLKKVIDFAEAHDYKLIKGKILCENEKIKKKLIKIYINFGFEVKDNYEIIKELN